MNRLEDFLLVAKLRDWLMILYAFTLSKLQDNYPMELLLFSLFFDLLVLSQQLLTVIIIVIIILRIRMYPFLHLLLLTIILNKLFRVSIFWKRVISQINTTILLIQLNFFRNIRFVISNKVDIVTVDIFIFSVSYLFMLDYLNFPVFLSSRLGLSFLQLGFEISLSQFIKRSLSDFSLL